MYMGLVKIKALDLEYVRNYEREEFPEKNEAFRAPCRPVRVEVDTLKVNHDALLTIYGAGKLKLILCNNTRNICPTIYSVF